MPLRFEKPLRSLKVARDLAQEIQHNGIIRDQGSPQYIIMKRPQQPQQQQSNKAVSVTL